VIIENVQTVTKDREGVIGKSLSALAAFGYRPDGTSTSIIDASQYGLAQRRRRHFVVATRDFAFDLNTALSRMALTEAGSGNQWKGYD
jgi:site-specific DNA-cytosine methylase